MANFRTAGEMLFRHLSRDVILNYKTAGFSWTSLNSLLQITGQPDEYFRFLNGSAAVYLMRKLLRQAQVIFREHPNESSRVREVSRFIQDELSISLDNESRSKLSRYVIRAACESRREIPPSIKTSYKNKSRFHSCYLCDRELDIDVADEKAHNFFTLEHIWPTSMGGDSHPDNLLPACIDCQDCKKDSISWEWLNVHNFVYPANPSDEALKAIPWSIRIAIHYRDAVDFSDNEGISLRDAFRRIGPIVEISRRYNTSLPVTFFDLTALQE